MASSRAESDPHVPRTRDEDRSKHIGKEETATTRPGGTTHAAAPMSDLSDVETIEVAGLATEGPPHPREARAAAKRTKQKKQPRRDLGTHEIQDASAMTDDLHPRLDQPPVKPKKSVYSFGQKASEVPVTSSTAPNASVTLHQSHASRPSHLDGAASATHAPAQAQQATAAAEQRQELGLGEGSTTQLPRTGQRITSLAESRQADRVLQPASLHQSRPTHVLFDSPILGPEVTHERSPMNVLMLSPSRRNASAAAPQASSSPPVAMRATSAPLPALARHDRPSRPRTPPLVRHESLSTGSERDVVINPLALVRVPGVQETVSYREGESDLSRTLEQGLEHARLKPVHKRVFKHVWERKELWLIGLTCLGLLLAGYIIDWRLGFFITVNVAVSLVVYSLIYLYADSHIMPLNLSLQQIILGAFAVICLLPIAVAGHYLLTGLVHSKMLWKNFIGITLSSIIFAAFFEEIAKYFALRRVLRKGSWSPGAPVFFCPTAIRRPQSPEACDRSWWWYPVSHPYAIPVAGCLTGLGFGFAENIGYGCVHGTSRGWPLLLFRAFICLPLHIAWGGLMGANLTYRLWEECSPEAFAVYRTWWDVVMLPMVLHAAYNWFLDMGQAFLAGGFSRGVRVATGALFFLLAVATIIGSFALAYVRMIAIRNRYISATPDSQPAPVSVPSPTQVQLQPIAGRVYERLDSVGDDDASLPLPFTQFQDDRPRTQIVEEIEMQPRLQRSSPALRAISGGRDSEVMIGLNTIPDARVADQFHHLNTSTTAPNPATLPPKSRTSTPMRTSASTTANTDLMLEDIELEERPERDLKKVVEAGGSAAESDRKTDSKRKLSQVGRQQGML